MANLEVLALDTAVPQIRAPGAGDGYSVPRDMTMASGTTLTAPTVNATTVDTTNIEVTNVKAKDGTAALTIADSSGNLGLGVTPSAWSVPAGKTMELGTVGNSIWGVGASNMVVGANMYYASSSYIYANTGSAASAYQQAGGVHYWYTAPSGTAGNTITFTQAMTLDASGNWIIGGTTADVFGTGFERNASVVAASGTASVNVAGSAAGRIQLGVGTTRYGVVYADASNFMQLGTLTSLPISFVTNSTERARITAAGDFLTAGKTSASYTTVGAELLANGQINTASANTDQLNMYNTTAAAYRFYVSSGGTVFATNTTISAISDQRLKENVRDLDAGLDAVMALKPRKFDWKEGKGKNIKDDRGWIAQEFEQVFPDMIDTWKDQAPDGEEPYKSVRADLIPVLVKAIQEQQAMIETLKARLAALEAA